MPRSNDKSESEGRPVDLPPVVDESEPDPQGLRAVATAMNRLTDEMAAARPKVETIDRRQRLQMVISVLVSAALVAMIVVALNTRSLSSQIQDCIDPTGECYQQSRSRTIEVQKAIVSAQHEDVDKVNRNLCAFIVDHRLPPPPDCVPPTTGPSTTTTR